MKKTQWYKFVRFGFFSKTIKRYEEAIDSMYNEQEDISICFNQKPYMVIVDGNGIDIAACLWLEDANDEREFSIVVHPDHRQKGLAGWLMKEFVHDILTKKIKDTVCCEPVNPIMHKMILKYGFSPEYKGSKYWTYEF